METTQVQEKRRVRLPVVGKAEESGVDVDAILREFEAEQRAKLGLDKPREQWKDEIHQRWTASQRPHTTMLCGGLTMAQDFLISGALEGIGYRVVPLDVPDNSALQVGKEFGNRGQCNPTYFTVGNLIKHLLYLRDVKQIPTKEIIERYLFVTAGACGPCRFGTYVTEYRKALRDAGFDGFRVLLFQQQGGLKQA
ncbi:MAG TPA: 2-hydroxyglutaryl-CoA dehydratase, partial [Pseudomonadota bacterium]|nr:2-hydroxyglutaryl-CoA dehydratase [Pseudomonadota bacterium]